MDALEAVDAIPSREEVALKTERAAGFVFLISTQGSDCGRFGVEIGADHRGDDSALKADSGVPTVAPEHDGDAGDGDEHGRSRGAPGEDATRDEHEPDGRDEEDEQAAPDERAVGERLGPVQVGIGAALDGLPVGDVGKNQGEQKQAGNGEITATLGPCEAGGRCGETDARQHDQQQNEANPEGVIDV